MTTNVMPSSEGGRARSPILSAVGLEKSSFCVTVLKRMSIDLYPGEVHGLVGENGAGKSTLMKNLAGVYQRSNGRFRNE